MLRIHHQLGPLPDAGTAERADQPAVAAWLGNTLSGQESMLLVDTKKQAARSSAAPRAEPVRLGRVAEQGVPLGLQGTVGVAHELLSTDAAAAQNGTHP